MEHTNSIIPPIEAAVRENPENIPLRLHLVQLLLDAGRNDEALQHCTHILTQEPDNLPTLRFAADAAARTDDTERAERYRRLYSALDSADSGKDEQRRDKEEKSQPDSEEKGKIDDRNERHPEPNREIRPESPDEFSRISIGTDGTLDGDLPEYSLYLEPATIRLSDVAGMAHVKRRLELALFAPMRDPRIRALYGKSLRGGLLMYGPPGCGKTFLARAVAGELGAKFINVGLSDVLDMYLGQSERNLHEIFESARRNGPCVIFFDEIDALGRKRSLRRESAGRDTINQLLSELDGLNAQANEGIFILAATNHPWDVDGALRRPGRFDRTLIVLPPDAPARLEILKLNTRSRPVDEGIALEKIAEKTDGFSGADLAHLCDSAAELAIEDSLATGRPRAISRNDFLKALKEVKGSTRSWFETARNYALFANEGGMYDDLVEYLRANRMV